MVRFPDTRLMSNAFVKDVGGPLHLENAPESKAVPGQGVVLILAIELLKGGESNDWMAKAYGIQPNNIGKSQRVRNDA
jgi:hypothetical protein